MSTETAFLLFFNPSFSPRFSSSESFPGSSSPPYGVCQSSMRRQTARDSLSDDNGTKEAALR
jgi:hypothetical protein